MSNAINTVIETAKNAYDTTTGKLALAAVAFGFVPVYLLSMATAILNK